MSKQSADLASASLCDFSDSNLRIGKTKKLLILQKPSRLCSSKWQTEINNYLSAVVFQIFSHRLIRGFSLPVKKKLQIASSLRPAIMQPHWLNFVPDSVKVCMVTLGLAKPALIPQLSNLRALWCWLNINNTCGVNWVQKRNHIRLLNCQRAASWVLQQISHINAVICQLEGGEEGGSALEPYQSPFNLRRPAFFCSSPLWLFCTNTPIHVVIQQHVTWTRWARARLHMSCGMMLYTSKQVFTDAESEF